MLMWNDKIAFFAVGTYSAGGAGETWTRFDPDQFLPGVSERQRSRHVPNPVGEVRIRSCTKHERLGGKAGHRPTGVGTRVRPTGAHRREPSRVASFGCSKTTFFEASSETHCAWSGSSMALVETSGGSASPVGADDGGEEWTFGACAPMASATPDAARRRTAAAALKVVRLSLGWINSDAACTKEPGG